jgi:hypothetical protein
VQLSASPDFGDAEWQPFQPELSWTWPADQPRILYVRFQSLPGLWSQALTLDPDLGLKRRDMLGVENP